MGSPKQQAKFGDDVAKETRVGFLGALSLAAILLSFAHPANGARTPTRLASHVVWWQGDRIYLAAPDSLKLESGTLLTFQDKKKTIATGEVMSIYEQTFLVAKLTSGSFKKIKHPDRLA